MKYLKSIGYGVLIWIIIFTVGWIASFVSISFVPIYFIMILIAAVVAFLLARTLNLSSRKEILKYSFTWAVIDVILTYAIVLVYSSTPISQNLLTTLPRIFNTWTIIKYLAILLIPLFAVRSN